MQYELTPYHKIMNKLNQFFTIFTSGSGFFGVTDDEDESDV
ncbi:MAG: hypothetical protein DHS20C13_29710 [Thermodesulfobacteriota bacterium]|nr:MAG: hypothetical protein DHS20C13_29710 [Thermodesulfobacteriota bacterium]